MKKCYNKNEIEKIVIEICEKLSDKTQTLDGRNIFTTDTVLDIENGIDSLTLMNIFIEIEQRFGIDFDGSVIEKLIEVKTVGNLTDCIEECIGWQIA